MSDSTRTGDYIECPACGFVDLDSSDFKRESGEVGCPRCEAKLSYTREVSVTYTTELIEAAKTPEQKVVEEKKIVNLMDALKASLEAAKKGKR